MRQSSQTEIGIVLTKQNAVLSTGSKHPIWLVDPLIDKVVDQNADIGLVAPKNKRILSRKPQNSIHPSYNALCRSFLVTCRTIYLPGQEEIVYNPGAQRVMQVLRIKVIVLDSIGRLEEDGILQPLDSMNGILLNFQRKRGRKTLKIILRRSPTLRFQEKLMRILIGKSTELVFDAGAVPRTLAMNTAGEKWRPVESRPKNLMHPLIGMKQITVHLLSAGLNGRGTVKEREALWRNVTSLTSQLG